MQPLRLKSMTFASPPGADRMTDTLRVSKFASHDRLPRGRREANAWLVGSPSMILRPGNAAALHDAPSGANCRASDGSSVDKYARKDSSGVSPWSRYELVRSGEWSL